MNLTDRYVGEKIDTIKTTLEADLLGSACKDQKARCEFKMTKW